MSDKPMAYVDPDGTVVYRAFSISTCSKALILSRLGVEGAPPPESMQLRFDDGHLHEPAIISRIEEYTGWKHTPDGSQNEVELPVMSGVIIRGHTDGIAVNPAFNPDQRILEAKALADSGYKAWKAQGFDGFPYYRDQLTVYMHALDLPAIFAVKNKNSGVVDVTMVDDPPGNIDEIVNRIKIIEAQALNDDVPGPCDRRSFPCPFYRFHEDEEGEPEHPDGTGDTLVGSSDPESLDHWLIEYANAREDEKEAKERKDTAKAALMAVLEETGAEKLEGSAFKVSKKKHTFKWLDEAEMEADGIDPEIYRREKYSWYPDVRRRGKKK